MTDKEKIRAFVEGRRKENWEKRYNNSGGDLFWDRANEDDEILSFIDSLQEQPVNENLEEEIKRNVYDPLFDLNGVAIKGATGYLTVEDVADIARHFANWQKSHQDPVSKELEEASRNYADDEEYGDDIYFAIKAAFKAGAQWQKEKDDEEKVLTYKHGFEDCKKQMMAKAIDVHCFGFQGAALFSFRLPTDNYLVGSEVKVIVIKED